MKINTVKLLDVVALIVDLPNYNLWQAQVGTVVEILANGFERHFGAIDLGFATNIYNESIDGDLAAEYASTYEEV